MTARGWWDSNPRAAWPTQYAIPPIAAATAGWAITGNHHSGIVGDRT